MEYFKRFINNQEFNNTTGFLEYVNSDLIQGYSDWFKGNGEFFEFEEIDTGNYQLVDFPLGECFLNAQKLFLSNKNYKYCEGIILGKDFRCSVFHAFNLRNNKAIDGTFSFNKEMFQNEKRDSVFYYYGIKIPADFTNKILHFGTKSESILFEYYQEYQLSQ